MHQCIMSCMRSKVSPGTKRPNTDRQASVKRRSIREEAQPHRHCQAQVSFRQFTRSRDLESIGASAAELRVTLLWHHGSAALCPTGLSISSYSLATHSHEFSGQMFHHAPSLGERNLPYSNWLCASGRGEPYELRRSTRQRRALLGLARTRVIHKSLILAVMTPRDLLAPWLAQHVHSVRSS